MLTVLSLLHALVGLIVLVEGLNKLERTDVLARGLTGRERAVMVLKAAGWFALVLGAGGAVVNPFLPNQRVELQDLLTMAGFALLVVRSRLREVPPGQHRIGSDEFERTQALRADDLLRAALRTSMVIDRDVNRAAGERAREEQRP